MKLIPNLTKKRLYNLGIREEVDNKALRQYAQRLVIENPDLQPEVAVKMAYMEWKKRQLE
jgi:hypothetical protein